MICSQIYFFMGDLMIKPLFFLLLVFYFIHNPVIGGIVLIPRTIATLRKMQQKQKNKKKFCFIR